MLATGLAAVPAAGQTVPTTQATQPTPPPRTELTVEVLQERLKQIQEDVALDQALRGRVVELYTQAISQLNLAAEHAAHAAEFDRLTQQAPKDLEAVKAELNKGRPDPRPEVPPDATLAQIQQLAARVDDQLTEARRKLDELDERPKQRTERQAQIAQLMIAVNQRQLEIENNMKAAPPAGEPAQLAAARRALLSARNRATRAEADALRKEMAYIDATAELSSLRRDLQVREVARAERLAKSWQEVLKQRRDADIQEKALEARRAQARAHPAVKELAGETTQLIQRRKRLVSELEQLTAATRDVEQRLGRLQSEYSNLETKIKSGGISSMMVLQLRNVRTALPKLSEERKRLEGFQRRLEQLEAELYELKAERRTLSDLDTAVEQVLNRLGDVVDPEQRYEVAASVREVLRTKAESLRAYLDDGEVCIRTLIELNANQAELVTVLDKYALFIDQHILWIRSHDELRYQDLTHAGRALQWLFSRENWSKLAANLWEDARLHPLLDGLPLSLLLLLAGFRLRHQSYLAELAEKATQSSQLSFAPTAKALLLTAVLTILWPGCLMLLAWRIMASAEDEFSRAIGQAMMSVSALFVMVEGFRQVCRRNGLAEAHLGWSPASVRIVRHHLPLLMGLAIPATFIGQVMRWQDTEVWRGSLGRMAFVLYLVVVAVIMQRILRPHGGIFQSRASTVRNQWGKYLNLMWYLLGLGTPLTLAGLALWGYYYTSIQLGTRLRLSVLTILLALVVRDVVFRSLLLARRRLAIEAARRKRAEMLAAAAEAGGEDKTLSDEAPAIPLEEPKISLSAVGTQTQRLVQGLTALGVLLALFLIWVEVLPALAFLRSIPIGSITVGQLGAAVLVALVAAMLYRNLSGFLEVMVLHRLGLEAGERYAIVTICRYLIAVLGTVVAFMSLGINWGSVHWLVAAMTVGLGFGLQEIFANFVSGLIILFERPIRVGDTVTVGDISGTVTRIRIRATTIMDWNRKELIIPNKEFVTGKVINWTLTDPILRAVIPVGVAYGSDLDLAEQILYRVAREHPNVMKDPAPVVVFAGFGSSSLDLELRIFVPRIDMFLMTQHEVRRAIDREFRKAGIEIAFPQQDVHIRTVPAELAGRTLQSGPLPGAGGSGPS